MLKVVRKARGRKRAFTLLEVIIVIVILGLLAAFVVPNLFGVADKQKIKITQSLVDSGISGAIDAFRASMGRYPKELKELFEKPDSAEDQKNWVKIIEDPTKLRDAWLHELIYVCPGEKRTESYDLSSPGPDGIAGNDDDVTNWTKN